MSDNKNLDPDQNEDGSWKSLPQPVKPGDIIWFKKTDDIAVIENRSDSLQPPWAPQHWYAWDLKRDCPFGAIVDKELRDVDSWGSIGSIDLNGGFMTERHGRFHRQKNDQTKK